MGGIVERGKVGMLGYAVEGERGIFGKEIYGE